MPQSADISLIDHRERKYLDREESDRFHAAIRAHPGPPVQTLALTGRRP